MWDKPEFSKENRQGFTAGLFSHSPLLVLDPCHSLPQANSFLITWGWVCRNKTPSRSMV
jgi:hypothetical protein